MLFNIEITKNGQFFGTVRYALLRIIRVLTEERKHINRGKR
jgi:hypothetical protein